MTLLHFSIYKHILVNVTLSSFVAFIWFLRGGGVGQHDAVKDVWKPAMSQDVAYIPKGLCYPQNQVIYILGLLRSPFVSHCWEMLRPQAAESPFCTQTTKRKWSAITVNTTQNTDGSPQHKVSIERKNTGSKLWCQKCKQTSLLREHDWPPLFIFWNRPSLQVPKLKHTWACTFSKKLFISNRSGG